MESMTLLHGKGVAHNLIHRLCAELCDRIGRTCTLFVQWRNSVRDQGLGIFPWGLLTKFSTGDGDNFAPLHPVHLQPRRGATTAIVTATQVPRPASEVAGNVPPSDPVTMFSTIDKPRPAPPWPSRVVRPSSQPCWLTSGCGSTIRFKGQG